MTGRCDSNSAQYERNRRFGHLLHVLGRESSGAKLPFVGLRLNASKSESRLSTAPISCAFAANAGKISAGSSVAGRRASRLHDAKGTQRAPHRRPSIDEATGRSPGLWLA
ncbi:hypothetical protein MRX96_058798 [Rhipicephalus microplus]